MNAASPCLDLAIILGRARERKLNATALQALFQIVDSGPEMLTGLALRMKTSTGAMTEIADRLERLGFAKRKESRHDRRVFWLTATPEGEAAIRNILNPEL